MTAMGCMLYSWNDWLTDGRLFPRAILSRYPRYIVIGMKNSANNNQNGFPFNLTIEPISFLMPSFLEKMLEVTNAGSIDITALIVTSFWLIVRLLVTFA
jgi:hypothetical protein